MARTPRPFGASARQGVEEKLMFGGLAFMVDGYG